MHLFSSIWEPHFFPFKIYFIKGRVERGFRAGHSLLSQTKHRIDLLGYQDWPARDQILAYVRLIIGQWKYPINKCWDILLTGRVVNNLFLPNPQEEVWGKVLKMKPSFINLLENYKISSLYQRYKYFKAPPLMILEAPLLM